MIPEKEWLTGKNFSVKRVVVILGLMVLILGAIFIFRDFSMSKDLERARERAIRDLYFSNVAWCGNFDVVGQGDFIRPKCDWPVITIASYEIEFEKNEGLNQVCAYLEFNREVGLPGDDIFQVGYKTGTFCGSFLDSQRFDTDSIKTKIREFLNDDLVHHRQELCQSDIARGWVDYELYCSE